MRELWRGPAEAWREWRACGASRSEVSEIRHGVRARWGPKGPPPHFSHGASLDSMDAPQRAWWERELPRLTKLGVLKEITRDNAHWVSRIFLVPKKVCGVFRMVVDLRHVNTFSVPGTAEVETLRRLPAVLCPEDHMVSLDLSDGYYHFRVHPSDQQYFQFQVGERFYQLQGLNMGWTRSPGVFTDFLKIPVRLLRAEGARLLWYLDDFLLMGKTEAEVQVLRDKADKLLFRQHITMVNFLD